MVTEINQCASGFHHRPEILHELMAHEVRDILLISSLYNIYAMEEDGSLPSKIISEYSGLNLSTPPVITGAFTVKDALSLLREKEFDMVLIVPHMEAMDVFSLGIAIKKIKPEIPVILLSPSFRAIAHLNIQVSSQGIDKIYIWYGHSDLLIALVKNAEDHLNAFQDTRRGNVRVVILAEDSLDYNSLLLPTIYHEIVSQTEELLATGLNENLKLLTMRARPKILIAKSHEEALSLYQKYKEYLLCVISDTRLSRNGEADPEAGVDLLGRIRRANLDLPLLLVGGEPGDWEKSHGIPALYMEKHSPDLTEEMRHFFTNHLGFGDFIFYMPGGREVGRARNFLELDARLATVPGESIFYHASRDHFSNWLMARSEIGLALEFKRIKSSEFENAEELRDFLIQSIHRLRKMRQQGVVSKFDRQHFDPSVRDFVKIGQGSMGGKARGLAFISGVLKQHGEIQDHYPEINIKIPKTMVICTDLFESFVAANNLEGFSGEGFQDAEIAEAFLKGEIPEWLTAKLRVYLEQVTCPLAVRSSSQLEDAHFQPYAGLYKTYKIPNNHPDLSTRLCHLVKAIKLVYASSYYEDARAFYRNTSTHPFSDSMAVIIQEMAGDHYGDYFYPAISGVALSYNHYPFSRMKPEEGIVYFAMGLGKTVVEGEKSVRFSPRHPNILPQFSSVEETLKNTQTSFYALKTKNYPEGLNFRKHSNLEKRDVDDAEEEFPVKALASTYLVNENRIRNTWHVPGPKVLTFSQILQYSNPPVFGLIADLLELGSNTFGGPVEIEFSVNLYPDSRRRSDLFVLQIRPMVADERRFQIEVTEEEKERAFCYSSQALGNGINEAMADIVYVKPDDFKAESTVEIAGEIGRINAELVRENRPYLLVGPGRWGSSDRWLGIPVKWSNISGVGAIVELKNAQINADPSQGSHFFHNITSLGIHYITVNETPQGKMGGHEDFFDWEWLSRQSAVAETRFLRHVRLEKNMLLKVNVKKSQCVLVGAP